jgi:steroid delta-isomerase-like uncharacterized protein
VTANNAAAGRDETLTVFYRMLTAMNEHDLDACVACYSVDAELQDPRFPEPATGLDVVREGFRYWFDAFPDVVVTVNNLIIDNGQLAVEWTFDATHQGEYMGVRPSGRRFQVLTAAHFRIENGLVTRDFSLFDASGLRQLEKLTGFG